MRFLRVAEGEAPAKLEALTDIFFVGAFITFSDI